MLVKVLSLGTNWWSRSRILSGPQRQVYYNSTGVRCGRKVRRHWLVPGLLRFHGFYWNGAKPDPLAAAEACGGTFLCSDLAYAYGGNRLLFLSRNCAPAPPDFYLVTVSSETHGAIDFFSNVWRSVFTRVIAISQLRDQQEAMLLMGAGDWVQTANGFWRLPVPARSDESAALIRTGAGEAREEMP